MIITSIGASSAVTEIDDDEPMCRHTTVPVSSHAAQNGSQWSVWKLGSPSLAGFSENVTARQPFSATRCTLGRHQVDVPDGHDRQRDEAAGVRAAPLVDVPVVVALEQRVAEVACRACALNNWPQKPGIDGKHSEPSTPFTFMSRTRSWMSYAPLRISSNAVGSKPYSSGGRPATALSPTLGIVVPSYSHTSASVVDVDHPRRVLEVCLRHVALPHVGRLDDVVVDADEDQVVHVHGVAPPEMRGLRRAYVRWPRHPTVPAALAALLHRP